MTGKFIKPIKLEFEKVYFPYLLISKKRYAGLYWTKPEKYDKMDSKGIEVRKILPLIHIVCQCTLDRSARQLPACIHCHRDLPPQDVDRPGCEGRGRVRLFLLLKAQTNILCSYVKQTIADLLQNKIDMSQLVITKALSKTGQSLSP